MNDDNDVLEMTGQAAPSKREILAEMLRKTAPGADYADDDALFSQIIEDYAEHGRLLAEAQERERQAEIRGRNASIAELMSAPAPKTDGTPRLGGPDSRPAAAASIFDLAKY